MFFSFSVEYLNCKAEIIRDIPTLDKVTPPMLVSAQACVARSMEENWYIAYYVLDRANIPNIMLGSF